MDDTMAYFRQIHVSIWKDEWFLELTPEEKLLFIYLFSNENTSIAGIYKIALRVIAFETNLELDFIKQTLTKFENDSKVTYRDGVVWVKNLRKYNDSGSNSIAIRIASDLEEIPESSLKQEYIRYHSTNTPCPHPVNRVSLQEERIQEETRGEETRGSSSPSILVNPESAVQLYQDVTGQVSIPNTQDLDRHLDNFMDVMNQYQDYDTMVKDGKRVFAKWCTTKRKDGQFYSKVNPGWVTKWLEELAPKPIAQAPPTRTVMHCPKADELRASIESGNGNYLMKTAELSKHMKVCPICQTQN